MTPSVSTVCPECNGEGRVPHHAPIEQRSRCKMCHGNGFVLEVSKVVPLSSRPETLRRYPPMLGTNRAAGEREDE